MNLLIEGTCNNRGMYTAEEREGYLCLDGKKQVKLEERIGFC